MDAIEMYNLIDAAHIAGALTPKAANAWMAAGDNATGAIDSVEFKRSTVESLSITAAFLENEDVREYFKATFGYTY